MPAAQGSAPNAQQGQCEHKASRLRGGGAGKVCHHPHSHIRSHFQHPSSLNIAYLPVPLVHTDRSIYLQDCFIGLIGCFLCFGKHTYKKCIYTVY
jgi:hypothetical protein